MWIWLYHWTILLVRHAHITWEGGPSSTHARGWALSMPPKNPVGFVMITDGIPACHPEYEWPYCSGFYRAASRRLHDCVRA